jgi:PKD repeat protein
MVGRWDGQMRGEGRTRPFAHAQWRLPAAVGTCLLMLAVLSAHAWAKGYGELARLKLEKSMHLYEGVNAFGADPANNDVYVGGEEGKEEESGQYKIQRLELVPHKNGSKVLASISFTAPIEPEELLEEAPTGIEGIAVDSERQRIYVLVRYERAVCEEYEPGKTFCPHSVDVAGALYAFSTANGTLTAVGSEGGLIAGFSALNPTTTAPGGALLNPQGITLDPVTHEVVILGEVNEATLARPSMHTALWSVNEKGEVGSAKYVSPKTSTEEERQPDEYNSPVVSSAGGINFQRENVGGELYSVPASLNSSSPPEPAFDLPPFQGPLHEAFEQKVFEFATSNGDENTGATFSLGPEGIAYSAAEIYPYELENERVVEGKGSVTPGVAAFNYTEEGEKLRFSDRGWTGGREEPEGSKVCAIGFQGETYWMVAAGKEHKLFVLNDPSETQGEVIEFGSTEGAEKERTEAEECPEASVTRPRAEVSGSVVTTASTAAEVKLVSEATSNILKAEWNFGDGSPVEKVETGEYQTSAVVHKFIKTGKLKVSVTVETDDLAGVEKASKTTKETEIEVEAAPPEAKATYSANNLEVTFNGGGSSAPPGEAIKAYHWSFGDGATTETSTPSVEHTYAGAGEYTAELTVSTEHQTSGTFTLHVKVSSGAGGPGGPPPGGGGGGGGGGPAPTTTTTTTETPKSGKEGFHESSPPVVTIAGTSLKVTPAGAFVIKLSCPSDETSCSGTLTLQTLNAFSAAVSRAAKHKKAPLTLASGSFTVAGGHVKALTLHLSSKAKQLLKRSHTLRARVTIVAHNPAGTHHTAQAIVTLRRA